MPSANKDRKTISLHLDKRVYALLKRCSEYEKIPMSRIVDRQLSPYVEKYQYDTLEKMKTEEPIRMNELYKAEEATKLEEFEAANSNPLDEGHLSGVADILNGLERQDNAPQNAINEIRQFLTQKLSDEQKQKVKEIQLKQIEENKRWIEIVTKYPLP